MTIAKTQDFVIGDIKKHSVRYEEIGDPNESDAEAIRNSLTGTVYIRKTALPKPFPQKIRLTMEIL